MRKKQRVWPKILFIIVVIPFIAVCVMACLNFCSYVFSRPAPEVIDEAKAYAEKHGLRTDRVVLCDFSRHSGTPRFWIYNCDTDKVIARSLCAHGCGEGNTPSKVVVSNRFGSRCSSAAMRGILIHSGRSARHYYFGMYPFYIPLSKESEGCFSVSDRLLTRLIEMTGESEKKLLLYAAPPISDNRKRQ